MPTNITENPDDYPVNLVAANDGEDADHASLLDMLQKVANRTAWLKKRLWGYGTVTTNWLTIPLIPVVPLDDGETGQFEGFSAMYRSPAVVLRQVALGGSCFVMLPPLLNSMLIKEVVIYAQGRGAHTDLPAMPPKVELRKQSATGAGTLLGSASDGSGSVAQYHSQSELTIEVAGSESVLQSNAYYLRFFGEDGANALAEGWQVYSAAVRVQGN